MGDGSKEFGGNVALFDMHAALQWISEYIAFFGGDKNRIKVMGHGSGASAAIFLTHSPRGRSSIDGLMVMSGCSLTQYSIGDDGKNATEEVANAHNCPHNDEMELIKCLRSKSVDDIIIKDTKLQIDRLYDRNIMKAMGGMIGTFPTIESKDDDRGLPGIITENPKESLKKEPQKKVPLLIGSTKHETANIINLKEITKIFGSVSDFLKLSVKTLPLKELFDPSKQVTNIFGPLSKYSPLL